MNRNRSNRLKAAVGRDALGALFPNTTLPLSSAQMSLLFTVQQSVTHISEAPAADSNPPARSVAE